MVGIYQILDSARKRKAIQRFKRIDNITNITHISNANSEHKTDF